MTGNRPAVRPARPFFSSGPCAKRPGWTPDALNNAFLGRSHRGKGGIAKLRDAIDRTKALLRIPADYRVAIVPASDTGAVELAMWNLLGPKPVDLFAWESFGEDWITDTVKQLKLKDARIFKAPYGELPDLKQADPKHDIVFVWNGTTSGVRVPNGDFLAEDREGVTICDATSAAFAMSLPWEKLDATTFSWQKALGGEAAHGMLVLSPSAVARIEAHSPHWPMPKIFRVAKGGKLNEALFAGETLNTPSMLAVEDYLDALTWAEGLGLPALYARAEASAGALAKWVNERDWIDFLAKEERYRSITSVCLKFVEPSFAMQDEEAQRKAIKKFVSLLENEGVAYDIGAHRNAPPGLRIWCGATVDTADIHALTHWLDWAWAEMKGR